MQLKCLNDQNFAKTVHNLTSKLDELDFFDTHKAMCGSRNFFLGDSNGYLSFPRNLNLQGGSRPPWPLPSRSVHA